MLEAAWLAPLCRLFVHKVRAGEQSQTIAWLSYYPHTQWSGGMRPRFGAMVLGAVGVEVG